MWAPTPSLHHIFSPFTEVCLFLGCTNGSVFLARWGSSHDLLAGKMSSEGLIEIWRTDDIGVHQIAWQVCKGGRWERGGGKGGGREGRRGEKREGVEGREVELQGLSA